MTYAVSSLPTNGVLRGSVPNLVYVPKTNYFGEDAFYFRVRDGLVTSPPARIAITVTPVQDVPQVLLSMQRTPPDLVVWVTGEPYQGYALQGSTNLADWVDILEYTNGAIRNGLSIDPTTYPRWFFRARTLP